MCCISQIKISVTDVLYRLLRIPNESHSLHSLLFFFLEAHHQLSTHQLHWSTKSWRIEATNCHKWRATRWRADFYSQQHLWGYDMLSILASFRAMIFNSRWLRFLILDSCLPKRYSLHLIIYSSSYQGADPIGAKRHEATGYEKNSMTLSRFLFGRYPNKKS